MIRSLPRKGVIGTSFTVFMLGLIALAVGEVANYFFVLMLLVVLIAVGAMNLLFESSMFFSIALANFIGIYACAFIFFTVTNFSDVAFWSIYVGYVIPLVAFVIGAVRERNEIRSIVGAHRVRDERHFGRVLRWLLPVFAVGAATFFVEGRMVDSAWLTAVFLGAMALIGGVVFFASRDVATFMLDVGLLFEEFFQRVSSLLVPAFAFLTFYSVLVIVFGCIYRIIDRFSETPQFHILGEARETLSFPDALYFSLITVSTVGYGEIVPASNAVKAVISVQILCGVILLLFGFYELINYTRGRLPRTDD